MKKPGEVIGEMIGLALIGMVFIILVAGVIRLVRWIIGF